MSDSLHPHRWQPTRLPRPWDSPGKNTGVGCHFLLQCRKVKSESEVAQLCPILSDPMDCSLPGSSVHGIFQARVLEWGATAFSDVASGPPLTRSLLLLTFCMNYCVMFVTTVLHLFIPFPSEPWEASTVSLVPATGSGACRQPGCCVPHTRELLCVCTESSSPDRVLGFVCTH